ncbi:universal stress protein [Tateyamaria armeniaca]|uniref:Universal stress protein n=1 Tax=Tateyamaria armeniaca TaxID=2518930 RepID=A0ABW8UVY6_9RHOB
MDQIMVATDLSDRSEQAVQRAVALASAFGARLAVHSVIDSALPNDIAKDVQAKAEKAIEAQVSRFRKSGDLNCEIVVEIGDAVEAISQHARQSGADLLVLGVHRHRAFLDQMRETTMERLMRMCHLPVLLVKGPADDPYGHVLCGLDFSRACASAIGKTRKIAPDARLSLFHAYETSFLEESKLEFDTWRAVHGLRSDLPEPTYFEGSAADAIDTIMIEQNIDLLAIGRHTRTSLGQLFLGSVTAGLIRRPPCDILVTKG